MIETIIGAFFKILGLVLPYYKGQPRIRVTAELAPWDAEHTRRLYEHAGVKASDPRGPIRHVLNLKVYAVGATLLHLNEMVMAYREPTRWKTEKIAQQLDVTVSLPPSFDRYRVKLRCPSTVADTVYLRTS